MRLDEFIDSVSKEVEIGIENLSNHSGYIGKPVFKGPSEIWYCKVGHHSDPKYIINFAVYNFTVEFKKLKIPSNEYNLSQNSHFSILRNELYFMDLVYGSQKEITENFENKLLSLWKRYMQSYIKRFEFGLLDSISSLKNFEENLSNTNNGFELFEEPPLKVFSIVRISKSIGHKRGESYWIQIFNHTSYEIILNEKDFSNEQFQSIKEYLKNKTVFGTSEEPYGVIDKKDCRYRNLNIEYSYLLNHYSIEKLTQCEKGNIYVQGNSFTKKILITSLFFLFGNVQDYIKNLKREFKELDYALYTSMFLIERDYFVGSLDSPKIYKKNSFNDFITIPNYLEVEKEVYEKFKNVPLDQYLDYFLINSNIDINGDVNRYLYSFFKGKL